MNTAIEETPEAKVDPNVTIDTSLIKGYEIVQKKKHAKIYKAATGKSQENLKEFFKRQNEFLDTKEMKLQAHRLNTEQPRFEPEINEVSNILASFTSETVYRDVYHRLSNTQKSSRPSILNTEKDLTYQPTIDSISRRLAHERNTFEQLSKPNHPKGLTDKQLAYLNEKHHSCTFRPHLNSVYVLQQDLTLEDKTKESQKQKERWLREQAALKSKAELI